VRFFYVLLFRFFCRHMVPRLLYLKETNYRLVEEPAFKWTAQIKKNEPRRPTTVAVYENENGRRAQLTIEVLPRRKR